MGLFVKVLPEKRRFLQDVFTNVLVFVHIQKTIENDLLDIAVETNHRYIRKKRAETFSEMQTSEQADEGMDPFENFVSDLYNTPDTDLLRKTIWDYVQEGLAELPLEQREVFIRNEFEGISFREMAEQTGVNINTLLARKRYAVLHLRRRLQELYNSVNEN